MKRKALLIALLALLAGLLSAQNMFGALKITTQPKGAIVSLYGTNQYLGTTPNLVVPLQMNQNTVFVGGRPGRMMDVLISKPGYITQRQQIFVPYTSVRERDAVRNPTVFQFSLQKTPSPPTWGYNYNTYYYYPVTGHQGPGHTQHYSSQYSGSGQKPPSGAGIGSSGTNFIGNNQGGHGSHAGNPRP